MTDSLLARAERGELDPAEFSHADHVELGFRYLERFDFATAVTRVEGAIRQVAGAAGAPDKYNATITWAYMAIIAERMHTGPAATWDQFRAANPDLFEAGLSLLLRYYSRERLMSDTARRCFVLPERAGQGHQGP